MFTFQIVEYLVEVALSQKSYQQPNNRKLRTEFQIGTRVPRGQKRTKCRSSRTIAQILFMKHNQTLIPSSAP